VRETKIDTMLKLLVMLYLSDGEEIVATAEPDDRKVVLTGLKPSTKYSVCVQPFNDVGYAKPSPTATVTTQDGRNPKDCSTCLVCVLD